MYKKITLISLITLFAFTGAFAQTEEHTTPEYGSNILRFSPITALDIGVGAGLSYERLLGKDKMIGVVFPVHLILQNKDDYYNYANDGQNYNAYVYFTPGIKIYPFGQRRITYAIGPNLLLSYGGGKQSEYSYDTHGNQYPSAPYTISIFRVGILVNNYINFQITPYFNLGLEGGLGIRYLDHQKKVFENGGSTAYNNGFDITGLFSLSLGYRF